MKCLFFSLITPILFLMHINGYAQLKELPPKKADQISGWLNDYSTFIDLDNERKVALFRLFESRFLQKDSIHNVEGLSRNEKIKKKKEVDENVNTLSREILSYEEYIYIKSHHLTLIRLQKINFIAELDDLNYTKLLAAMREMRCKNTLLINKYGRDHSNAQEKMKANRAKCSEIEQEVFTKEMYDHLYEMNFLTVVDWSTKKQSELSTLMEGYNVLDPMDNLN